MGAILAIANQKGGVGKTTTAVNLAASLSATRNSVLLIDIDPQGNATMGCGVAKYGLESTVCELLMGETDFDRALVKEVNDGFDLLPANGDLVAAEIWLMENGRLDVRLRELLTPVRDAYDFIIIDCPPSLNILTINALTAADGLVIPLQCEYYALEGLSALVETIEAIRSRSNPNLKIEGIVRTMYDSRNKLTAEVNAQLFRFFGNAVYRTVVPRNVKLAEAPSFGKAALSYEHRSKGAIAYLALAGELLRRRDRAAVGAM
ncbi:MAG: ParA family protein [Gammaproteobacteria bacterium]|nr:ParA family protein [Gammaproteobacteria bacterium]MYC59989.1 ParA family protein [Gammaproteobacteria bacterium]MYH84891.1 ParA family protein [Gammaproteobacteria bacterium]MYK03666.1 ParA family protein [Gammaproteobacteria bacterium]